MNMKSSKLSAYALLLVYFLTSSCGSSGNDRSEQHTPFDPVGKWEYKVTTDVSYGVIDISKQANTYTASMTTEVFGTLEIMNLKIKETVLTGDLDVGGTPAKIRCEFQGDKFEGVVTAGETTFPMEGQRADN